MSLYQIRPLGLRESLIAFEIRLAPTQLADSGRDIREAFVLWDPQGRPHRAYPDLLIERAMTGREFMALQSEAWARHVASTRRLFGTVPLSGPPPDDAPLRGLLAFDVPYLSVRGRWTLSHVEGVNWYFTPSQLRDGTANFIWPGR